jgi:hypothetical protein
LFQPKASETPTATLTSAATPWWLAGFLLRGYQKPPIARGSMRFSTASRRMK